MTKRSSESNVVVSMERFYLFVSLIVASCLLGSCVYVPPEYYGGPPPPPEEAPPYYHDGPPPDDFYFGRGKSRRDYEMDFPHRRRGRTEYLREVDPAYALEDPAMNDPEAAPQDLPPDREAGPDYQPSTPSERTPPPPSAPEKRIDPTTVPYATRTNTPGRAKSPYPPYRELDVSGMKSGSMAKDPTTGKVFRVP